MANNDPDKISNENKPHENCSPRISKDQKSTTVNVSTHVTQRRDQKKIAKIPECSLVHRSKKPEPGAHPPSFANDKSTTRPFN